MMSATHLAYSVDGTGLDYAGFQLLPCSEVPCFRHTHSEMGQEVSGKLLLLGNHPSVLQKHIHGYLYSAYVCSIV